VDNQRSETYLNHPSFGLLYRICEVRENQNIFTTLYAQRLFFLVTVNGNNFTFEPISRADARVLVENRLRQLRHQTTSQEYQQLQTIYQRTFQ
jgi:PII interaction protein X